MLAGFKGMDHWYYAIYGTPEGTFFFQHLPEKKSKQKELEMKTKQ